MGLNLVTTGLGSYLATAVVNIVNAATSPSEYTSFRLQFKNVFFGLSSDLLWFPLKDFCSCSDKRVNV